MAEQENIPFKFALNLFSLIKSFIKEKKWSSLSRGRLNCRGIGWWGIFRWKKVVIRRPHWPFYGFHIYPVTVFKRATFLLLLSFHHNYSYLKVKLYFFTSTFHYFFTLYVVQFHFLLVSRLLQCDSCCSESAQPLMI